MCKEKPCRFDFRFEVIMVISSLILILSFVCVFFRLHRRNIVIAISARNRVRPTHASANGLKARLFDKVFSKFKFKQLLLKQSVRDTAVCKICCEALQGVKVCMPICNPKNAVCAACNLKVAICAFCRQTSCVTIDIESK